MHAVEMRKITKSFHGMYANRDVDFYAEEGEIHSLLGENGAGKTTLMNILFGLYRADSGKILLHGKEVLIRSSSDAISLGISMVHQHFVLVNSMTVAENIIIGNEPKKGIFLDSKKASARVKDIIDRYRFRLNPDSLIGDLSVGERQRVEILKALYNDASVILLDEPTAVLTPVEVDELFVMLRELKKTGKTIIIITHKLKETLAIADSVTVLRKGEVVKRFPVSEATEEKLAELMVGRQISFAVERQPYKEDSPVRLSLRNISLNRDGRDVLKNVSLDIHSGEVLGIAGVEGNGQTELIEVVTGISRGFSGDIFCGGEKTDHINPRKMLKYIGHIPEDREKRGYVRAFTNWENMILGYQRNPGYSKKGFLKIRDIEKTAERFIKDYDIRTEGPQQKTASLSGGNVQKLIVGRTLMHQNYIILAAQPTRGVDIGAIEYIHSQLMHMRDTGSAVMLISADLDEVIKLSDRIAVMYEGAVVITKKAGDFDRKELGYYMLGGKA